MKTWTILPALLPLAFASPINVRNVFAPVVTISSPQGSITGVPGLAVEQFRGIPFAQAPVGPLRLKPPQPITAPMGNFDATGNTAACPQFLLSTEINDILPTAVLGKVLDIPLFQKPLNESEDCLGINIFRPAGITPDAKLPVLVWIFGGGFVVGWNSWYDGVPWIEDSIALGEPVIMVTVNYRLGGFGYLPGKEVLADGSANLGQLDQRLALKWIADNINDFGGDPSKVTIWGESAGEFTYTEVS